MATTVPRSAWATRTTSRRFISSTTHSALQPKRGPVPAPGEWQIPDALPSERQRPYGLRGRLPIGESGPGALGPPPPGHDHQAIHLGVDEDRRRTDSDRDARRLVAHLPRRPDLVQRLRLLCLL